MNDESSSVTLPTALPSRHEEFTAARPVLVTRHGMRQVLFRRCFVTDIVTAYRPTFGHAMYCGAIG
jgi:hypothetical protein